MTDHFIDHHLNFKRLFAEAVEQSVIDATDRSLIEPGYFRIRLPGKDRALVAARIFERDPDDGDTPVGEVLGESLDPVLVWAARDREPLKPRFGLTIAGEYAYQVALHKWAKENAPGEPIANPRRPVDLTKLEPIAPPPPPPKRAP